jgi:hypothetical protein
LVVPSPTTIIIALPHPPVFNTTECLFIALMVPVLRRWRLSRYQHHQRCHPVERVTLSISIRTVELPSLDCPRFTADTLSFPPHCPWYTTGSFSLISPWSRLSLSLSLPVAYHGVSLNSPWSLCRPFADDDHHHRSSPPAGVNIAVYLFTARGCSSITCRSIPSLTLVYSFPRGV